jgi:hypothetical protein
MIGGDQEECLKFPVVPCPLDNRSQGQWLYAHGNIALSYPGEMQPQQTHNKYNDMVI